MHYLEMPHFLHVPSDQGKKEPIYLLCRKGQVHRQELQLRAVKTFWSKPIIANLRENKRGPFQYGPPRQLQEAVKSMLLKRTPVLASRGASNVLTSSLLCRTLTAMVVVAIACVVPTYATYIRQGFSHYLACRIGNDLISSASSAPCCLELETKQGMLCFTATYR
jgi:hypothetical protein